MAARDQRRPARGRRPGHRLRPALGAESAADPRPRELRGPGLPHRRVAPRRRPRRQARRRGRHRLQRDPGRAGDPARGRPARRLPALARLDPAEGGLRVLALARARLFRRFPALRRLDRASVFAFQELAAAACTRHRWLLPLLRAARHAARSTSAIADPELRRKVTPTDEFGCKRIMLTDDWYPTLTEPNVELVDGADRARSRRAASATPPGSSAPPTRSSSPPASPATTSSRRWRSPAATAARLAEEWAEVARAYLGLSVPGFPNMFLLYGPNTNGGSGSVVNTLECGIGHVLAALREMERAEASRIEVTPRGGRGLRPRAARRPRRGRSGTAAAATGTSTRTATTRATGPGLWSTYRRRTRELGAGRLRAGARLRR